MEAGAASDVGVAAGVDVGFTVGLGFTVALGFGVVAPGLALTVGDGLGEASAFSPELAPQLREPIMRTRTKTRDRAIFSFFMLLSSK